MRRIFAPLASSVAAILMAVPASAATYVFASPLSPEVSGATGSGFAQAIFDTDAHTLAITANWTGLTGVTTISHLHCCVAPPGTVGVAVTPGTLPGFPSVVTSGTYSTTLDLTQPTTYTGGFLNTFGGGTVAGAETALLSGLQSGTAYFNIHTNVFPSGEIRGFLSPVPEPAAWAMMLLGFGMVGAAMRSAKRRQNLTPSYN